MTSCFLGTGRKCNFGFEGSEDSSRPDSKIVRRPVAASPGIDYGLYYIGERVECGGGRLDPLSAETAPFFPSCGLACGSFHLLRWVFRLRCSLRHRGLLSHAAGSARGLGFSADNRLGKAGQGTQHWAKGPKPRGRVQILWVRTSPPCSHCVSQIKSVALMYSLNNPISQFAWRKPVAPNCFNAHCSRCHCEAT